MNCVTNNGYFSRSHPSYPSLHGLVIFYKGWNRYAYHLGIYLCKGFMTIDGNGDCAAPKSKKVKKNRYDAKSEATTVLPPLIHAGAFVGTSLSSAKTENPPKSHAEDDRLVQIEEIDMGGIREMPLPVSV